MDLFATCRTNVVALILRFTLGGVILVHGLQKTLGWFDGPGFEGAMGFLGGRFGAPVAFLVILAESLGAFSLMLGFITRICAAGIGVVMAGAMVLVHWQNGFFASNGGFEFHILAMSIALCLVIRGGGAFSIDELLMEKRR